jgi:hypothetical protein
MANTYTLISSSTVGSGGASSIQFTSIPQTYTDLKVLISVRNNSTNVGGNISMGFNGSTSNYTELFIQGGGSGSPAAASVPQMIADGSGGGTANMFNNVEVYISNYAGSTYKTFYSDSAMENNNVTAFIMLTANLWSDTAAITSIEITNRDSGINFVQNASAFLYGIKNS